MLFTSACFLFLLKAIRKTARRNFWWGRSASKVPVSRLGYAIWGVSFLVIAAALFKGDNVPLTLLIVLVGSVLGIIMVGFWDTYVYRRRSVSKHGDS